LADSVLISTNQRLSAFISGKWSFPITAMSRDLVDPGDEFSCLTMPHFA